MKTHVKMKNSAVKFHSGIFHFNNLVPYFIVNVFGPSIVRRFDA